MQNDFNGVILAVVSMAGLGISSLLYKQSTSVIGPVNTTFFYYLFSVLIAAVVWCLFREERSLAAAHLVWPALIAVFLFSSVLAFNHAVRYIDVSVASTIRSLSFAVTVGLALCFFKERLYLKDYLALGLAVVAVLIFGMEAER